MEGPIVGAPLRRDVFVCLMRLVELLLQPGANGGRRCCFHETIQLKVKQLGAVPLPVASRTQFGQLVGI